MKARRENGRNWLMIISSYGPTPMTYHLTILILRSLIFSTRLLVSMGHDIRSRVNTNLECLLNKAYKKIDYSLEKIKKWDEYGCGISTDRWTGRKYRNVMNLYIRCKKETSFIKSIEDSTNTHTLANISLIGWKFALKRLERSVYYK